MTGRAGGRRLGRAAIALGMTGAVLAAAAAAGAPGDLDPGFGGDGIVTTDFGADEDRANVVITLDDGRIVAAGRSGAGPAADLALARYLPNGSPDTSFGGGDGEVTQDMFGSDRDAIGDLDIDPDGNLVAAGITDSENSDFALARFLPGGGLDSSFNPGGVVPGTTSLSFTNAPDTSADQAVAVEPVAAGRLVVAGFTQPTPDNGDTAFARYDPNGTIDDTYGPDPSDGSVVHDLSGVGLLDVPLDAEVHNGKIYVTGIRLTSPTAADAFVARLTADGALDTSYGGDDGIVAFSAPNVDGARAESIVVEADGSAVIGGNVSNGLIRRFFVARFRPSGKRDNSFGGGDGFTITNLPTPDEAGNALVREPGGRLTLVGLAFGPPGTGQRFAAARYLANGRIDRGFAGDGIAIKDIAPTFPPNEVASSATLARSGSIVAAGYVEPDLALLAWQGMPSCFGRRPTLAAYPGGTPGSSGADVISGDAGKLKVNAGGGDDRACGGPQKDKLKGQSGDDKLNGGSGNDKLSGGAGRDVLKGGPGKRDVCRSGSGADTLRGCERGR